MSLIRAAMREDQAEAAGRGFQRDVACPSHEKGAMQAAPFCLAHHSPIFFFKASQVVRTSSVRTEQDSISLKMRCASLRK